MTDITTVLLIKESAMDQAAIRTYYLEPLAEQGIPIDSVIVRPLFYNTSTKVLAKTAKAYLDKLITKLPTTATNLIIADGSYFKFITKVQKIASKNGATVAGEYPGYEHFTCVYVPNHKSLFKQPENKELISVGLAAITGNSNQVVIKSEQYAFWYGEDREILDQLHQHRVLTADIETDGLGLDSAIVSIAFAWTKHDGVAIDLSITGSYYLKQFLQQYTGKLIFHGALFDAKILIRNLWMKSSTDWAGMLRGLKHFDNVDCTMIMAFLAKNATTNVSLSLKDVALEYVGNYAIEIEDISKYTKQEILRYNLIDVLGTFYIWEKYNSELTSQPYVEIFRPSIYPILKMMLVGLPVDPVRVQEAHLVMNAKEKILREQILTNRHVMDFTTTLRLDAQIAANAKLKVKVKPLSDFDGVEFNPGSDKQLAKLLFTHLKLPVLDTTKSGAPATGGDVLKNLVNHTEDSDIIELLTKVQELADNIKINGTFLKAFLLDEDGYVHGNLKLGGTQSGRLSSNSPNLTNLPSHGPMGKLIKSCVVPKPGWLFACADFAALEERIGAILSQDPNRIKVYTDGFDSHSMRALKYFGDQMPDIVAAINKAETATNFWIDENGEYCCD